MERIENKQNKVMILKHAQLIIKATMQETSLGWIIQDSQKCNKRNQDIEYPRTRNRQNIFTHPTQICIHKYVYK